MTPSTTPGFWAAFGSFFFRVLVAGGFALIIAECLESAA